MNKIKTYLVSKHKYFLYNRVISCFVLAILHCCVFIALISFLSCKKIGVGFDELSGGFEYRVANPITIVSYSATFVTLSTTLLGFALNNFSKRGNLIKNDQKKDEIVVNDSVFEEAANILLVRYRGKAKTLLFFNVFCFPLLAKAFTLFLFLLAMLIQCFFGYYRIFYLIVYASIITIIILSLLIDVFKIYADVHFTLYKACSIISSKLRKKLIFLHKTAFVSDQKILLTVRCYLRTDIFRNILFLNESFGTILYLPKNWAKSLKLKVDFKYHMLIELLLCSQLSYDVMFERYVKTDINKETFSRKEEFLTFIINSVVVKNSTLKTAVEDEMNYINNVEDNPYKFSAVYIKTLLRGLYDKISKGGKKNVES